MGKSKDTANGIKSEVDSYLTFLKATGRTENTISSYHRSLEELINLLGNLAVEEITNQHLLAAVAEMCERSHGSGCRSQATMNRIKSAIRSFFQWAYKTGRCSFNPADMLHLSRNDSCRTTPITMEEIEILLTTIVKTKDKHSLRDQTLFSIYAFTGIRRNEALNIRLEDIDLNSLSLFIAKPKGHRSRFLPIPTMLAEVLRQYISKGITDFQKPAWPLFPGSFPDKTLSAKQVWLRFDKWKKLSGIRKRLTVHSFRAGFATMLYRSTGNILLVSRALGHADIKTTERYIADDAYRLHSIIETTFAPLKNR